MNNDDNRVIKLNPVEIKGEAINPPPHSEVVKPVKKTRIKSEKMKAHLAKARNKKILLKKQQAMIDLMKKKIIDNSITTETDLGKLFVNTDSYQAENPGADQSVVDKTVDDAMTEAPIGEGKVPDQPSNLQVYHEEYKEVQIEDINPNDVFISITPSENPSMNWRSGESWLDRF